MSFLHEIGHFLDHKGLAPPFLPPPSEPGVTSGTVFLLEDGEISMHQDDFASESNPALSAWRKAVMASEAIKRLQEVMHYRSAVVTALDGTRVPIDIDHAYVSYLLDFRELFARSYAQYILSNSQNDIIQRQLDGLREEPLARLYPLYWDEEDFLAINEAMDDVFLRRGWTHE